MKYISYYHGYPTRLGNKDTGWISCYKWKPFGLRTISSLLVWIYHNWMCYNNIKHSLQADRIICVSNYARKHFIKQAKIYGLVK